MEGLVNQLEQGLTPLEAMSLLGARAAGRSPEGIPKAIICAAAKVVTAMVTTSDEEKMSEFDKLLNDLAAAQRQRAAPRRTTPPARALPLPRMRPDRYFAKAVDAQLTQLEGAGQMESVEMQQAALGARIEDIRARARQAIDRAMAEIKELIPQGRITPVEVAERQILLDAFARRMGL